MQHPIEKSLLDIFSPIPPKQSNPIKFLDSVEMERDHVLHKMYVSNVGNRLREMDVPSDIDCQRWPWELMQNAKDSIAVQDSIIKKDKVDIQLFLENDKVIFMHNGLPFNGKAYLALLYKYSDGKANNAESTGRFGTGFLTTHSLSKIVKVEGDIFNIHENLSNFGGTIFNMGSNIASFEVTMYRDGSTPEELIKGIEKMENEKRFYIGEPSGWTIYTYILKTKRNHESSELGFENFKVNIAQTMLFNQKFGVVQLTYKDGYKTTIKHLSTELFDDVSITTFQLQNEKEWKRKFIIKRIFEHSDELTKRFEQDRNLRLSGCIELTENDELIYDEKSPCFFCSLPLVGSESHEFPITLNSDDFEPNTERQGILLAGSEKKQDKDCLSDVGINRFIMKRTINGIFDPIVKHCSEQRYKRLYVFTRGLKNIPNVASDFDGQWFKENIMIPYRNILKKYPVVFTDDENGFKKIEDVFIPIYPEGKDNEYKQQFHHFTKILFGSVPCFDESIEWSERIWNEDLTNLVEIERLLLAFKDKELDIETKNSFIKFAWENHRDLLYEIPVLINQNGEYINYSDNFADGSNVQNDAVDLMEELEFKWKEDHLHRSITSIKLPLIHDHQYAMGIIRENDHPMKKYILSKYIIEGNEKREKMFMFAKEFFPEKFAKDNQNLDCYVCTSIDEDLWDATDSILFRDMISVIEDNGNLDQVQIPNFIEFIEFVRKFNPDPNIFDNNSIIPAKSGIFHKLKQLFEEKDIPQFLFEEAKKNLDYDISDQMKDPSFSCVVAPKEYNILNFMTSVNKKLKDDGSITDSNKLKMSLIILSFLPEEEGDLKNHQIHLQDAARILKLKIVEGNSISHQNKIFWEDSNTIVISEIERLIQDCGTIDKFKSKYNQEFHIYLNQYIDLLHHQKAKIIPNQNGKLCLLSDLSNDINIPEEVKKVFIVLGKDLKPKLKLSSINIKCQNNETIVTIIGMMNDYLKTAKEKVQKQAAAMIIDMVPSDPSINPQQTNIQNLYHKLTKTNFQVTPIECTNEAFWTHANRIIIKFCESLISQSESLTNLCLKTGISNDQYIEILNKFQSILNVNDNAIIPNYYGYFKKKTELYSLNQPEGIFKAIKNHLNADLFSIIIDKRVQIEVTEYTIFETAKLINAKMNRVNESNRLQLSKEIIKFIPKDDKLSANLKNLLYIVNKFDGTKYEPIEVELCEGLYSNTKPYVIKYINQKIEACKTLNSLSSYFENPIDFINKNIYILNCNVFKIIPDQEGSFHYLSELKHDDGIYNELKDILRDKINLYKILVHKGITAIQAKSTFTNDSILRYIEENASDIAFQMLHVLPEKKDARECQEKLLHLFRVLTNDQNETTTLKLQHHFWTETNKVVIQFIIEKIKEKNDISQISDNHDEAISILKILYEFVSPSNYKYKNIKMIPNQLGQLLSFDELYNEQEEIPEKFKDVLKDHFSLDIRKLLQDSRLSIKVEKSLCIESTIITDAIRQTFTPNQIYYPYSTSLLLKEKIENASKAFILFTPKGENTKVLRFINCYKNLLHLDYDPILLLTSNENLWDTAIKTLTKNIISQLYEDKNLKTCANRISSSENEVINFLNSLYEFASQYHIYPNMYGVFLDPKKIYTPENIDETILDILALLSPQKDFRNILVHPGINKAFSEKTFEDIAKVIDDEISLIMKSTNKKDDENIKKGCELLIMKYLRKNQDKKALFRYVEEKKMNIILEIIVDKDKREIWKKIVSEDPLRIFEIMTDIEVINQQKEELSDIDSEDIKTMKQLKKQNASRTLTVISSLNQTDQQYLNDHADEIRQFIQNKRENEERQRQLQRENEERQRQYRRDLERMQQDRERRLREMQELHARPIQSNPPNQNNRRRNNHINNVRQFARFVHQQPVHFNPPPPPPVPFERRLTNALEELLRTVFKRVIYEKETNNLFCSLIDDEESDEYLIIPVFADENNEINLNQNIVEITSNFQDLSVIFIVPNERDFNENTFKDNVKIITNIGFDVSDLNIVDLVGELVDIDDENFAFKGCDKYYLHVKENYIANHQKHFDQWKNIFNSQ